jgi:hypothetical protein
MNLDDPFWPALWQLAIETATRPEIYLAVWLAESGLEPAAKNPIGCIGLNQSCPKPYGPGFPHDDAAAYQELAASRQLEWIAPQVRDALAVNGRPFGSAARYYQANFLPATLNIARNPRDVIAARAGPFAQAYAANQALDFGHDGAITLEDLGRFVADAVERGTETWTKALAELYARRPPVSPWREADLVIYEPGPSLRGPIGAAGLVVLIWGIARLFGARV